MFSGSLLDHWVITTCKCPGETKNRWTKSSAPAKGTSCLRQQRGSSCHSPSVLSLSCQWYKPEDSVIGLTLCHTWKTWEWEKRLGDSQTRSRCWNLGTSTIVLFLFWCFTPLLLLSMSEVCDTPSRASLYRTSLVHIPWELSRKNNYGGGEKLILTGGVGRSGWTSNWRKRTRKDPWNIPAFPPGVPDTC